MPTPNINDSLLDLFQSITAGFGALANRPNPIEEQIARVIEGRGQRTRVKFSPLQNEPKERQSGEPRKKRRKAWFSVTIDHTALGPDDEFELYDVLASDPDAMRECMDTMLAMIETAPRVWRNLLAKIMGTATAATAYNGVAFINTAFPVCPGRSDLGNQGNYLPNTKADKAGYTAVLDKFTRMKGHDGQLLHVGERRLVAVVPNDDLLERSLEVLKSPMVAQAVGANAAVVIPNQKAAAARIQDVILFPELAAYSNKQVHIVNVASSISRAYCVSKVRQPTPHLQGLNPNDPSRISTYGGTVEWGWDAFGGGGYGLPQEVVVLEEP